MTHDGVYARAFSASLALGGVLACGDDAAPLRGEPTTLGQDAPSESDASARGASARSTDASTQACDAKSPTSFVDAGVSDYPQVEAIIRRSCSYERCHAGSSIGGGLNFAPGIDYHAALVHVKACGYEGMSLVEPGAPERSWLMVKLTADVRPLDDPYATYIYFDPPAGWDPKKRRCIDQTDDGTPLFGQRMPATAPNILPDAELELIRRWIAAGAPR